MMRFCRSISLVMAVSISPATARISPLERSIAALVSPEAWMSGSLRALMAKFSADLRRASQ